MSNLLSEFSSFRIPFRSEVSRGLFKEPLGVEPWLNDEGVTQAGILYSNFHTKPADTFPFKFSYHISRGEHLTHDRFSVYQSPMHNTYLGKSNPPLSRPVTRTRPPRSSTVGREKILILLKNGKLDSDVLPQVLISGLNYGVPKQPSCSFLTGY
ncbi:hypothetical protein AVEN_156946-1 [Araneus ventricosus]|uniref:Uncharacterized protein n=1 Tax=Araneus ventricosus TaxID=182803 RepID=A0A4Y2H5V0_ARAVE|nr:hypothetical protein AVEN_156946-1 [Araneus ventricosus]